MTRPAKSVKAKTGNILKSEEKSRLETENKLKGKSDKLVPPEYLTKEQADVFYYILENLDESKMLGNLDQFILARASITICQLKSFDIQANANPEVLLDSKFRMAKDAATKDFFRCCNELCLSPQSRAKLSISAVKAEPEKKSLMDILNEEDDD